LKKRGGPKTAGNSADDKINAGKHAASRARRRAARIGDPDFLSCSNPPAL
jgi:hypothetical protein